MGRAKKQQAPKVVRDEEGLARLRARGVTRALTLWPEWGVAFTKLDKRVENRPMPPFRNIVGTRVAFHMGKWIGGRKAGYEDGIESLVMTALASGWMAVHGLPLGTDFKLMQEAVLSKGSRAGEVVTLRFPEDIVTSAITFTAIIGGFHPPTADPKIPWQVGTPPGDDEPAFAWIVEDVEVLETPVACPGAQGVWTL